MVQSRITRRCFRLPALVLMILLSLSSITTTQAEEIDVETRVALQLTLESFIESKTQKNVYPFFDPDTAEVSKLKLRRLHPVIFRKDDFYLMCADFMDTDGKDVLIDYIVGKHGTKFQIEQEIIGRRSWLTKALEKIF